MKAQSILFEIHDSTQIYHDFWSRNYNQYSQYDWVSSLESKSSYIYSRILPEYGYSSKPIKPKESHQTLELQLQSVREILDRQMGRLQDLMGLDETIGDIHLLPLNQSAPSLTGCWTDFKWRPQCIIGFDGFLGREDFFALVSAHEMTHALHMHFNHPGPTASQIGTFAQCLWNEGLAEYISLKITPELSSDKILRGKLANYSIEDLKPYFKLYVKILDTRLEESTFPIHSKWFGMGGEYDGVKLPAAAAYIMGYRTIEKLSEKYPLRDLVKMHREGYTELLRELFLK